MAINNKHQQYNINIHKPRKYHIFLSFKFNSNKILFYEKCIVLKVKLNL